MMKISWGYRIALVYVGFVILIMVLVIASTRQHFDLVTKDYYGEEIAYQKVLDAGKNQAALPSPILVQASAGSVNLVMPAAFNGKQVKGQVNFYSPMDSKMDKTFALNTTNCFATFSRDKLAKTTFVAKINFECDGKQYYQETPLNLTK